MEDNRIEKLTDRLERTETQSDYYKKIAIEAGKTHLQEAEHLSSIIQSYKQIVSDLEKQIADRKSAEDTVKESHQLLLTILNSIDASIFVADMDTYRILFANDFMINNFGKEIVGKICFEVFRKNDSPCDICTNQQLVDDQNNPSGLVVWQGQNPITKKWYINHDRAIKWPDGKTVRIQIATDISELKQLELERQQNETALRRSRQLELVGTLAGGIAHDFNNLLMGIQGWVSLISTDFNDSHPISEKINTIEKYIDSASGLTKQLLGLARQGKYEVRPIDINKLVVESSTMFGRTAKDVAIHTKLKNPPPIVAADEKQIEQVMLNLYINALQAMPKGGVLYLETSIVCLNDSFCRPYGVKPGYYVNISVADTGLGIDDATLERIFDPFFTTKDRGRGTGLGLASAYGIVKNHDGIVTVTSEPGLGSTFNLYLPISNQEVKKKPQTIDGVIRGSETILLVDDEDMIVEVGKAMLEKLGYRVVVAKDGGKAIDMVHEAQGNFDLIILDLVMPGMDGGATFDIIRKKDPKMPVLLSSGYSIDGAAREIMGRGCNGFIQKPFKLSEFSRKIRMILETGTA